MTATTPRSLNGEETTTSVPLESSMDSVPTWGLFLFLPRSSTATDATRLMEPGNLTQRDEDEHFEEDANENDFDDNENDFAHYYVVIFKK